MCVLEEFTVGIAIIVDACLDEIVALASDLKLLEFQLSNDFVSPYIISNLAASHSAVGNFSIILKQIFTKRFKHAIPKIFHYMLSRFFPPHPASLAFVFQLSLLSLSLSPFLSHCCCERTFPCAAGVVMLQSRRGLLRKHLWLPSSLWLCSLPISTTGAFEVMNEK